MRFELKFKYRETQEYFSVWHLEGKGTWEVNADDLLDELPLNDIETESIEKAILNYLWLDLNKDPDYLEFNKEDLESLIKYIKENYEIPSKDR